MKKVITFVLALIAISLMSSLSASAQLKYQSGRVLIGTDTPFYYYVMSVAGNGIYFNHTNGRFLQISVAATGAPRIAGHNDQIVFYNSQTSTFNSIQVSKVYNYSDARAKTGIRTLNNGLDIISQLRPVTYNFKGNEARTANLTSGISYNKYTGNNAEIGLLAQEIEAVLPNLVYTDDEGRKLVDYTAIIPILIDAVKSLQQEVETLKAQR